MIYSEVKLYKLVNQRDHDVKRMIFAQSVNAALSKVGIGYAVETITKFKPGCHSIQPIALAELKSIGIYG